MPDPLDAQLLALVAEAGRAPVHAIAQRLGIDVREAASRLAALATTGLPLVVGVECDPNGIRKVLSGPGLWSTSQPSQGAPASAPPTPSGGYPVQGMSSGSYPSAPSGGYPVSGTPSGSHPSGPHPAATPAPPVGPGTGGFPAQGQQPPAQPPLAQPSQPQPVAPQAGPTPQVAAGQPVAAGQAGSPPSTWGPPQSHTWARGDQPPSSGTVQPAGIAVGPRSGKVGETLEVQGLEGELLAINLVEVVDPADYLFTAAGYRLQEGERSVVVHTELTNKGTVPFGLLPDMYLLLVTEDDETVSKAPVSLSSRPPHRIGLRPGETAGGHTVYVLSESVNLTGIRWTLEPTEERHTLDWSVDD